MICIVVECSVLLNESPLVGDHHQSSNALEEVKGHQFTSDALTRFPRELSQINNTIKPRSMQF